MNGPLTKILLITLCALLVSEATDKGLHNNLYQEIVAKNAEDNIIYSPFSIQACLALAHLGASGVTADELANVIGYSSHFNHESLAKLLEDFEALKVLQVANKVYVKTGSQLSPEYETSVKNLLKSSIESINFADKKSAARQMSAWVEEHTNNKIQDMIQPNMIDELTNLILINAVYFKANWATEFYDAQPHDFTNHDQTVNQVPWIRKSLHLPYTHDAKLSASIVKIPYKYSTNMSMFVIIPDEKQGLAKIEQTPIKFLELNEKLESTFIDFAMPKFEFKTKLDLGKMLKKIGMPTALSGDADFSKMFVTKEKVPISDVIHEAFIKVDEYGTEAGAATAILMLGSSMASPSVKLEADRPFMFAIVAEGVETPLFMGAVKNLKK
ncbi:antichymotrypsin-2-like [Culicoides brevitarsis]|uniref:antichymotrypsin-2-like n=1 Tax=Culicoides brevitarsis TaxID=469753 RepID=UPI00307BBB68